MQCEHENCGKRIEIGYLVNGMLLCFFCAEEEKNRAKRMGRNGNGNGLGKGSPEAKEKMAEMRTMRKTEAPGIAKFIYSLLGEDIKMDVDKMLEMVLDKFPGAKTKRRSIMRYKRRYIRGGDNFERV